MALTYYEWRLLIGPPWRPHWDARAFDWSVLDWGDTGYPNPPSTTLTADLTDGQTIAQIANALEIWPPEGGGFWCGPNGAGEGWEYIEYEEYNWLAYNLRDLHREPSSERTHNGIHTLGAEAKFWYEVDNVQGASLRIEETLNAPWAATTWKATVSGLQMPRLAVRNNHLALIQIRTSPTGSWANERVGWLASPQFRDDFDRNAAWSAQILCAAHMADRQEIAGITAGEMDIAEHGAAGGSTPLARAYKERDAGDYTEANPDLNPESTIDGDINTLWIAEQMIGTANWQDGNNDPHWRYDTGWNYDTRFVISGICLERPTGYNSIGYRWIELTAVTAYNGSSTVQDCTIFTSSNTNYVRADIGEADVEPGQKIIICEDASLFGEENPIGAATAKAIVEVNQYNITIGNTSFWDDIVIAGDVICMRTVNGSEWMHGVAWGNSDGWGVGDPAKPNEPSGSNDHDYFYWDPGDKAGSQTAAKPSAPSPGECLRYIFDGGGPDDGDAQDYWSTDTDSTPGYTIGDFSRDAGEPNAGQLREPYLIIDLPVLPLRLRDAINASTTDPIYIEDASGANTGGLDDAGTIQIADEQISYTSRTTDYLDGITRGVNSTTPAAHAAGDQILFVEASGIATDAHPVMTLSWDRAGGTIYPKNFNVYTTTDPNAPTPETQLWENDWNLETQWQNQATANWTYNLSSTERLRKVMIVFKQMTADPARPRLNEVNVILDGSKYIAGTFLTSDEDAGAVCATALSNGGFPAGAITDSTTVTQAFYSATASDGGWTVAADIADFANLRITSAPDSKVTITDDPYWGASSFTASEDWTRVAATAVEMVAAQGAPVRQVSIAWRTYDESGSGVVYYPSTPDTQGAQLELGPYVYLNEATALAAATKAYYVRRMPYIYVVEVALDRLDIYAGEIHDVRWEMESDVEAWSRKLIVESVVQEFVSYPSTDGLMVSTVITGTQIDRQTE